MSGFHTSCFYDQPFSSRFNIPASFITMWKIIQKHLTCSQNFCNGLKKQKKQTKQKNRQTKQTNKTETKKTHQNKKQKTNKQ